MFNHALGLMVQPSVQWKRVADLPPSTMKTMVLYPCLMAILPAVAWYYGTTSVG